MTVTDANVDAHEGEDHGGHEDHAHSHPSDRSYVMIALVLAFLTAVEILLFVFEDDIARSINKLALVGLMVIKFYIVGAYFMHLKFDHPILTQLFVFGLVLAIVVYFIMLSAFEFNFWNDGFCDTGLPAASELGGEDFFANENCTS